MKLKMLLTKLKFDYTQAACYPYIMSVLSNSGDNGATFSYIANMGESKGYRKKSIVKVLKFLKKDGKTTERWAEEKVDSAIFHSYIITLKPEYRTAISVSK